MTDVREDGPFERILTVAMDEESLEAAKGRAARRLSKQMKIKGFRPGKAPRRIVESMVGADALRQEAIEDALPGLVTEALAATELEPAASPRVDEIRDADAGVEVDVRVTLWPEVDDLPEYRDRRIEVDMPPVDDSELDRQIDRLRDQFAELEDVGREGFDGDYVLIDLKALAEGEEIEAVSANDLMYEIGSGSFIEGLDEALRGRKAGAIVEFSTTLPASIGEHGGEEVTARVLVKGVKAKRLPEVTDEWVDDVSEFESVAEMRESLAEQLHAMRAATVRSQFEQELITTLRDEMAIVLPDALVEAEMDATLHRFAHRLAARGIGLEQYFELTGQEQSAFVADLRDQASLNLLTRILLEGVARAEGLEVGDDELAETVGELAEAAETTPEEYRRALREGAGEKALAGDILRRKAIDRLLELAVPVDADGNRIELAKPEARPGNGDEEASGADDDESGSETDEE